MSSEDPMHPKNIIPSEPKKDESYADWAKRNYGEKYETWMPWVEDQYLKWFGKDNKASYAAKDTLDKTKVTGIDQVDKIQDDVNNLAAGQIGKGGLLQPLGDLVSKEGVNRIERGGKDDQGKTAPGPLGDYTDPITDKAKSAGSGLTSGAEGAGGYAQSAGESLTSGAKGAGGYLGSFFGAERKKRSKALIYF